MIINFHPKEIESKLGKELIAKLNADSSHSVFHSTDKSAKEWQEVISGTEKLILVAPVYWWGAGYEFDKWIQNVFGYDYAFRYDEGMPVGLLNGREFEFHMTHGTPEQFASPQRENISTRFDKGIFGFCAAKVTMFFYDKVN